MSGYTLSPNATLMDAVRVIEGTAKRLAVVLSEDNSVIGTLTDGDIRRCLLQGTTLQACVAVAMNTDPVTAHVNTSDGKLRELLRSNNIRALPLLDKQQKFVRVLHEFELVADDEAQNQKTFSSAVIMAGGEGTRLRPFTDNLPKPMVDINGFSLLERQINRLRKMGIPTIYISVNYLGSVIKDYFSDGKGFGVDIKYLNENKKLGTAGALSLLPDMEGMGPIIVMNGDVLTNSDFVHLYNFHEDHGPKITVSAVDYRVEIPYGVIQYSGVDVIGLQEKPSQRFFCNAGIYALSVDVLKKIPEDSFLNMTDLVEKCLSDGDKVSVFPVHEYWSDIGTPADLERARKEFKG